MDVGLNNRNILGKENPAFDDVVFLVEANSNEQFELWRDWAKESTTNIEPLSEEVLLNLAEATKSWPMFKKITEMNDKVKDNQHTRIEWKQVPAGFGITIGHIGKGTNRPVCVSFNFAFIKGKKVCFYFCMSNTADYAMIESWLIERFQLTHDGYTRWSHVDANNFHNCVNSLDDLDKEPRDTVYKKKS